MDNKKMILTGLGLFAAYSLLAKPRDEQGQPTVTPPPMPNTPNINNIIYQLPTHATDTYNRRSLSQIDRLIIHHSATTSGSALAYANYHINENGWPGIAYHFVISKNGTIEQTNELDTVSYHTSGQNTRSIGICLTGNYDVQAVPTAQYNALIALIQYISQSFGELPIYGHTDFATKSCPGANVSTAAISNDAYNNIGRIVNRKVKRGSGCGDKRYSTNRRGPGVCSWHGGVWSDISGIVSKKKF